MARTPEISRIYSLILPLSGKCKKNVDFPSRSLHFWIPKKVLHFFYIFLTIFYIVVLHFLHFLHIFHIKNGVRKCKKQHELKIRKIQKKLQVQIFINIFIVDYSMHIGVI